jgi:hypothetical protein
MTTIQLRRDTAANWTSVNPTLASGEPGYETDTGKFKIGNGSTAWASLAYENATGPQGPQGTQGPQGSAGSAGAAGAQGSTGATGSAGAQGAQGPAGPQGATGSTGAQGTQGTQGTQGPSDTTERSLILSKGGAIGATETNAADFLLAVPFNMTLKRLKATVQSAVSGSMVVQLRRATTPVTTPPTYSDVTNWTVTFSSGNVLAVNASPTGGNVNVDEDDVLNFSVSTGSGGSLLLEVIGIPR